MADLASTLNGTSAGKLVASVMNADDSAHRMLRGRVRQWLRETVMLIVDRPADVSVKEGNHKPGEVQLCLEVHPEDIGKVIGKQGRNARSLRTIMLAMGHTQHYFFTLDIIEGDRKTREMQAAIKKSNEVFDPLWQQRKHSDDN